MSLSAESNLHLSKGPESQQKAAGNISPAGSWDITNGYMVPSANGQLDPEIPVVLDPHFDPNSIQNERKPHCDLDGVREMRKLKYSRLA